MSNYINMSVSDKNKSAAKSLVESNFAGTDFEFQPENDEYYAQGIEVNQSAKYNESEYFEHSLPDDFVDRIENGQSDLKRYHLTDTIDIIVESGANDSLTLVDRSSTWHDYFNDWDFGDTPQSEGMAEFGLDATPDEADADATDVAIWCAYNYYQNTLNAPNDGYIRDTDTYNRDIIIFKTVADAQAWIDDAESGTYYLNNNEAGCPTYTIVEA